MFKLVKLINSRTGVPEITTMPIFQAESYTANCLYFIGSGILSPSSYEGDDIKFIPVESIAANKGATSIRGFIVTSDMVFETDIYGDPSEFGVGDSISARTNSKGIIDSVEATEGHDAKIISKEDVKKNGKVRVVLKW